LGELNILDRHLQFVLQAVSTFAGHTTCWPCYLNLWLFDLRSAP